MRRLAAALAGGGVLGAASYFLVGQVLAGATLPIQAAVAIVAFVLGAFLTNLILDWLGY